MESNLFDSLDKIYGDKGFFKLYGVDLLITIIIIFVLLLATTYFYILNYKKSIEKDWEKNRCHPLYLPFAGNIVKENGQSVFDATQKNFMGCTNNILVTIVNDAFAPMYYMFNVLIESLSEMSEATNSIRTMFDKIRNNIGDTASNISNRTLNVTMPLAYEAINARDSLMRTHGIATTAIYQIFGLFTTVFSFFRFFKDVLIGLLVIMFAAIVALWVIAYFFFPATIAAAASTAIYIAILVPFLLVIKCSLSNNKMYEIDNIMVTGCHKILIDNNWILVCDYNKAKLISDYSDNIVFCLNTENKIININNHIFMDWDELDFNEIKTLKRNDNYNINKLCNNGISGSSKIITESGEKLLKDINIGDNLGDNNYVIAIINVLSDNLHIVNKEVDNENILLTLNLIDNMCFTIDDTRECNDLYQLKTTNGYYYIYDLKINDYDSIIKKILQ